MAGTITPGPSWVETQLLTRAAPTAAGDGLPLQGLTQVTVVVEAVGANTLSGAGTIKCWMRDLALAEGAGAWAYTEGGNFPVPASASGLARVVVGVLEVMGGRGELLYAASGVTVSGGTTCRVYLLGDDPQSRGSYT